MTGLITLVCTVVFYFYVCHNRVVNWIDDHDGFLEKYVLPIFVVFVVLSVFSSIVGGLLVLVL
ncbi:MAG: hypothetical protein ACFFG0_08225 [Candidatus Thorarchaeota archaeon]